MARSYWVEINRSYWVEINTPPWPRNEDWKDYEIQTLLPVSVLGTIPILGQGMKLELIRLNTLPKIICSS